MPNLLKYKLSAPLWLKTPSRIISYLFVRGVQKAFEVVFRPQKFVDFQIIAGVVAVIRKRLENRRKINYADAKFFKVIEFFANAVEVSAKKSSA